MPTLAILFFIFIGFYFGLIVGVFIAYKFKQWHDEDQILIDDVDEWMKNNNGN